MVSIMADFRAVSAAVPGAAPEPHETAPARWPLLPRLESTAIGARLADGTTRVRRSEPAGCILYGPYLHLPEGSYRLSFRCEAGSPRMGGQPVLGLEIIVLSRFQRGWQDFTAAELQTGGGSLIFEVPPGHSIESADAGRFEFRIFHFGNASLTITSVELERHSPRVEQAPEPRRWRMLGRLQKSWIGGRDRDGAVTVSRYAPPGCLLHGGWPYLRLPRGHYRLSVRARLNHPVTLRAGVTCPGLTDLGPWQANPPTPPPEFHPRTGRLTWSVELPAGESVWGWTWG